MMMLKIQLNSYSAVPLSSAGPFSAPHPTRYLPQALSSLGHDDPPQQQELLSQKKDFDLDHPRCSSFPTQPSWSSWSQNEGLLSSATPLCGNSQCQALGKWGKVKGTCSTSWVLHSELQTMWWWWMKRKWWSCDSPAGFHQLGSLFWRFFHSSKWLLHHMLLLLPQLSQMCQATPSFSYQTPQIAKYIRLSHSMHIIM